MHGCVRNYNEIHETVSWIPRPAKPGMHFGNISRMRFTVIFHTPCVIIFVTHISCIDGIEMALVRWIWCVLGYIFFKFAILMIVLINSGEICHWKRRGWRYCGGRLCSYAVAIVTASNSITTSRSLNAYCDVHNAWIRYGYSLSNLNRSRAIHNDIIFPLSKNGRVW